jgi:hypothetical protein
VEMKSLIWILATSQKELCYKLFKLVAHKENIMTIEKFAHKCYRISDIFYGQFVHMDYYDYTKKEAIKLFKQKLQDMKDKINNI